MARAKGTKNKVVKAEKPKTIPKETPYTASIKIFGKTFTAQGATASEAIGNIQAGKVHGRGILTIEKGNYKKDRVLMPQIVFRLFNSHGLTREVALKNASMLFGI